METITPDQVWSTMEEKKEEKKKPIQYPKEFFLHTIHKGYNSKNPMEWVFHFIQDKAFSKEKKIRVLRILFENEGRGLRCIQLEPVTFEVISDPGKQHIVTVTRKGTMFCDCEWEGTNALSNCTHIIAVRTWIHLITIGVKSSHKTKGAD